MYARSTLLSFLSLLVVALSSFNSAQAAMAQGDMNFTRDWIVQVSCTLSLLLTKRNMRGEKKTDLSKFFLISTIEVRTRLPKFSVKGSEALVSIT